jgi:hypothetical protein
MWLIELIILALVDAIRSRRVDMLLMLVGFLGFGVMAVGAALSGAEHRWGMTAFFGALSAMFLGVFMHIARKRS